MGPYLEIVAGAPRACLDCSVLEFAAFMFPLDNLTRVFTAGISTKNYIGNYCSVY